MGTEYVDVAEALDTVGVSPTEEEIWSLRKRG